MQNIVDLGTAFGPTSARHMTTFADGDSIKSNTLRYAYGDAVTPVGLAAGMFKLLRDPYLVQALLLHTDERPLIEQLTNIWEVQLASIFGDHATVSAARAFMKRQHNYTIASDTQAEWFRDAVGRRRSYSPGSSRRMEQVFIALCGSVARGHALLKSPDVLSRADDQAIYLQELETSFGWVCGLGNVALPRTIDELHARTPEAVARLLRRDQLITLGLDNLGSFLEMVILPNGRTIQETLPAIVALLDPDDIAAHGLEGIKPYPEWFTLNATSQLPHLTVSYRGAPPPTK